VLLEREFLSRGGNGSKVSIEEVQEPLQDEPQVGNIDAPDMAPNENQVEPLPQDVMEEVQENTHFREHSNISRVKDVQETQEAQEISP
jgi:hypothetical protein